MFGGGFFGGGGGGGGGGGPGGPGGFDGPGGFFGGGHPGRFDQQYQCFPVSFIGKDELEKGNKIILPQSALDHLARLNISYPMLFEINNPAQGRKTHGGVQEFIAEEGMCYLPYWMMQNLLISEGDLVRITNTSLPKGKFVKLQPVTSDFLEIHNPRAVLENTLRNFATLTVGDTICINYNQKRFEIEIIETKPAAAISIIEADVNVDFAPPKDYKEPEPDYGPSNVAAVGGYMQEAEEVQEEEKVEEASPKSTLFQGQGQRVDGKAIKQSPKLEPSKAPKVVDEFEDMPWKKAIKKGVRFTEAPSWYGTGFNKKKGVERTTAATTEQDKNAFDGSGHTLAG